jgi:arginase
VGLVYFDAHADLNVPDSVAEGALDWMGMAHMLAQPEALPELAAAFPTTPLLDPGDVLLFGWDPGQATDFEREVIARRGISSVPVAEVTADPAGAGARAAAAVGERCDRLLVHFDVDVIDFTDVPLSENTGRNEGLAYADAMLALDALLASPKLAGLTITELNPDHTETPVALRDFAAAVAASLAR